MHTGKSLTVEGNDIKKGSQLVQCDYQGLDSQKWVLRDSHKNGWVISSLINNELSISINGNIENGSTLMLSNTVDDDNQMFYLINISQEENKKNNGTYKIAVGVNPRKSLEVEDRKKIDNANLVINEFRKCITSKVSA